MSVGPTPYLVNKLLDHTFRDVVWTPPAIVYFAGNLGDPGVDGTANPSAQATRYPVTFLAAAGGLILLDGNPELTLTATEEISHGGLWDEPVGGNCLWTAEATVAKGGAAGDIIRLSSLTLGFEGIAA